MKKNIFSWSGWMVLSVVVFSMVQPASQAENAKTSLKIKKPDFIYAPKSFDSNDNAQVVLSGFFTGYCMKVGKTSHQLDSKRRKIYIDQRVSMSASCADLEMYIPYSSVVNLGPLKPGKYEIYALNSDLKYNLVSSLPVAEAVSGGNAGSSSTDERLYAPVSEISFKMLELANMGMVAVSGVMTNRCLELDEVEVIRKSPDVIEVLPIAKKSNVDCQADMKPFVKWVTLKDLPENDFLIHVRSMNGQSLNKVVTRLDRLIF